MKKARPSLGGDAAAAAGAAAAPGGSFPPALGDILAKAQAAQDGQGEKGPAAGAEVKMEEEEEL
jgi:hypothetical protein